MLKNLNLSNNSTYEVILNFKGGSQKGELIIDNENYCRVVLKDSENNFENNKESFDTIKCNSGEDTIILYECVKYGRTIYPKYISFNKPEGTKTTSFKLILSGLSDVLFDQSGGGEQISLFNTKITSHPLIYRIYDRWETLLNDSLPLEEKKQYVICLDANTTFSASDIKNLSIHIKTLFSALTLFKIKVDYVWMISKSKDTEIISPFYFSQEHFTLDKTYSLSDSYTYLPSLDNSQWTKLFNNSLNDILFEKLWTRLCGMLIYRGYWEFDILGFVSIFDYLLYKKYSIQFKPNKYSNFFEDELTKIEGSINSTNSKFSIEERSHAVFMLNKLNQAVRNPPNSFNDRFERFKEGIDVNIFNFFDLSDSDFRRIKKLRDGIAHSDPNKMDMKGDLTLSNIIKNKLIIMCTYSIIRDLGFTDKEYATLLNGSFNSILCGSLPSRKWLRKISGVIKTELINEDDYKTLMNMDHIDIILIKEDGTYKYNPSLNKLYRRNLFKHLAEFPTIIECINKYVCIEEYSEYLTKYEHTLHLYSANDDFIELSGVYVIEKK